MLPNDACAELDTLLDAYAEEDLSEAQSLRLIAVMQADAQSVDRFVRGTFLHWQLFELASRRLLQTNAEAECDDHTRQALASGGKTPRPAHLDAPKRQPRAFSSYELGMRDALGADPQIWVDETPGTPLRPHWPRWQMAAACALLVVALGVVGALRYAPFGLGQPPWVAQLSQATANLAWTAKAQPTRVGEFLHAGQSFDLSAGRVLVTFTSGARACVEGPAKFTVTGKNSMRLESGRVSAAVPPQAMGFDVETSLGRVRDLGTEFTVVLESPTVLRVCVFTGMVELTPHAQGDSRPVRVPESSGVYLDSATGEVRVASFDGVEFMTL